MSGTVVPGVTTRVLDYEEETRKAWGKELSAKYPVYQFSNGKKITNADEDGCGVYGTAADA